MFMPHKEYTYLFRNAVFCVCMYVSPLQMSPLQIFSPILFSFHSVDSFLHKTFIAWCNCIFPFSGFVHCALNILNREKYFQANVHKCFPVFSSCSFTILSTTFMYLIPAVIIFVAGEMSGLASFFCGHECPILPVSCLLITLGLPWSWVA